MIQQGFAVILNVPKAGAALPIISTKRATDPDVPDLSRRATVSDVPDPTERADPDDASANPTSAEQADPCKQSGVNSPESQDVENSDSIQFAPRSPSETPVAEPRFENIIDRRAQRHLPIPKVSYAVNA